ncbi:MAG: response regulator transcription factor [Balneolales bacterium]
MLASPLTDITIKLVRNDYDRNEIRTRAHVQHLRYMPEIRILIIEDNRLLREGITTVLKKQPDFTVVAALASGENVLSKIRTSDLDVVLLDVGLRSHNSLEVVKLFAENDKDVNVVVMGLFPAQSEILEYVREGVRGFLLKDATVAEFIKTIRSVASGEKVLPALLTGTLFSQIVDKTLESPGGKRKLLAAIRMTVRERQVIELIAEGLTNKEIAQKLHISSYTVKSHVHNILEKLTLHNRLQIAKYAHNIDTEDKVTDTDSYSDKL